jgi:hypothetical protein
MLPHLTVNWTPAGGSDSLSQDLLWKRDIDGAFNTGVAGLGPNIANYTIDGSFNENRIYDTEVVNHCAGGGSFISAKFSTIGWLCPVVSLVLASQTKLKVSFPHTPSSIQQYIIRLYDQTGTSQIDSKVISDPALLNNPGNIVYEFTNLQGTTNYKVRVEMYAGTFSKLDCPQTAFTTTSAPTCTAPVVTSATVS